MVSQFEGRESSFNHLIDFSDFSPFQQQLDEPSEHSRTLRIDMDNFALPAVKKKVHSKK